MTKNLRSVPNFEATLTAYNFGQNGRNEKVFVPIIKPARSAFWGKKTFFDFDPFWRHSRPKCDPTLKSASKFGTFASFFDLKPCILGWNGRDQIFFVAVTKPARSAFWGKKLFSISTHFGRIAGQTVSLPSNLPQNLVLLLLFLLSLILDPCNFS